MINGMQEIKLNNCETQKRWHWEKSQGKLFRLNIRSLSLEQWQTVGLNIITELKNIFISFVGAKAVVDWWLSKEGQQAVVKGWMHSVRGDVEPPKGAPALKTFIDNAVKIDWQKLADNNAQIKEQFRMRVME